jgi:uncharacterized delta-60 repeat protein
MSVPGGLFQAGGTPISASTVQSNGDIVVTGPVSGGITVQRLNPNGSLNALYGTNALFPNYTSVTGVAVDPSGNIIVAAENSTSSAMVRLTPTGSLDTTFGGNGVVTVSAMVNALTTDSSGNVYAAGSSGVSQIVERFTSTGAVDTSFGSGGVFSANYFNLGGAYNAITLDSSGRVVVAGYTDYQGRDSFSVARLTSNGVYDSTFNSFATGFNNFNVSASANDIAYALTIQPDGNILVAGQSGSGSTGQAAIARLLGSNGAFDSSFINSGGRADFAPLANMAGIALQSDGSIVLGGGQPSGGSATFGVLRLTTAGAVDTNYGAAGLAGFELFDPTYSSPPGTANSSAAVLGGPTGVYPLADGRVVVPGVLLTDWNADGNPYNGREFYGTGVAVTCLSDGGRRLDANNPAGTAVTSLAPGGSRGQATVVQPDGKIVVAGSTSYAGFSLVRYNSDGSLDTTFGSNGIVTASITGLATSVTLQPDGKILVAGANLSDTAFVLARYTSTGVLDSSFGTSGTTTATFPGYSSAGAEGLAIQPDGNIVVVGWADNGSTEGFALARFTSAGVLDTSFGTSGETVSTFPGVTIGGAASAVAIQSDGNIVLAGGVRPSDFSTEDLALARYTPAGVLDSSFGSAGEVLTSFPGFSENSASALAIQPDGKIVVAGQANNGPSGDFALARYTSAGALDSSFGTGGEVETAFAGSNSDNVTGLAIQRDGRIVAGGWAFNNNGTEAFALARYTSGGALDNTFGTNGQTTTSFTGFQRSHATALAIQPDNNIVLAGWVQDASNLTEFAVARYDVPAQVTGTSPSPTSGTLLAGTTSLQINFSKPVVGADQASNYQLQSVGPDGLLGTADDVIVPVSATYSGTTATLTFSALPSSVYRLTVSDNITDAAGNQIDGAATGAPGSNYTADFVVMGVPPTPLTSPNGFTFDPAMGGYGAGQLLQGTNDAFDGLNRLQVGGTDYSPALGTTAADGVNALGPVYPSTVSATAGGWTTLVTATVNVDATKTGLYDLHFEAPAYGGSHARLRYLVDGAFDPRYADGGVSNFETLQYVGPSGNWQMLTLERQLTLTPGTHVVRVQVYNDYGTMTVTTPELSLIGYNLVPTVTNAGQTIVTPTQNLASLNVLRQVTVPNTGSQDFARTVDYFQNPTSSPITTTVHIVGNLGSDAATRVFATSSGDSLPSPNDMWFGTDGGPGTTAVISIVHGPAGLIPTAEDIVGDNIEWNYTITVQPGQTLELGTFTIQASSEANAIAEANVLVTPSGFGGQAAEFLSSTDLAALANFQFPMVSINALSTPVPVTGTGTFTVSRNTSFGPLQVALAVDGSSTVPSGYTLTGSNVSYSNGIYTVSFADGDTSETVTFTPAANASGMAEAAHTLQLDLQNGSNYQINTTQASASITVTANGFFVTNTNAGGDGSLAQAVANADADTSGSAIAVTFDSASGHTFATPQTITLSGTELPVITHDMTITGPSVGVTISGAGLSRVFEIGGGYNPTVTMSNLTITQGYAGGSSFPTSYGGGVFDLSTGTVTLSNCILTDNSAGEGGGFYSDGTAVLNNCTISNNTAHHNGGGLANDYLSMTLTNCTIIGNTDSASSSDFGGGAVFNYGTITITNCTVVGNSAIGTSGGGFENAGQQATLNNSILAGNTAYGTESDILGSVGGDYDLTGDNTAPGSHSMLSANPLLGAPGNYGGITQTMPLLPGSPAIDAGSNVAVSGITTDQRGDPRITNGTVDIGAFESQGFTLSVTSGSGQSTPINTTFGQPLVVTVSSAYGEPVAGGQVTFTAPGSGASATLTGTPATIAASGQASVTATAIGIIGQNYTVTASAAGASAIGFTLSNAETPSLVVTTRADVTNPYDGKTSLREAIAYADSLGGNKTITFAPGLSGAIDLRTSEGGQGTLTLDANVTIDGTGASITIEGGSTDGNQSNVRPIVVNSGATAVLNDLTVSNGVGSGPGGGDILNDGTLSVLNCVVIGGGAGPGANGGGILNDGALTVTNCTLGSALANDGAIYGGGLYNQGTATLTNTTVTSDGAVNGGGGIGNTGTITLLNCTLTGDHANFNVGGGALYISAGSAALVNCTLAGNTAAAYGGGVGGGIDIAGGTVTLSNTIVAANSNGGTSAADDIQGAVDAAHSFNNLIGTGGAGGLMNGTNGNQVGMGNPLLARLGNFGGPTQTIALLPGSPAIDAGNNALAVDAQGNPLTTDQRGFARIVHGTVDIGAFEVQTTSAAPPAQVATEGTAGSFALGSFADANPQVNSWTVDVAWGDNSTDTVLTTSSQGNLGSLTHTFTEEGTYTVTLTVRDANGDASQATFHIAVADAALHATGTPVSAIEGQPVTNVQVATFTDDDPGGQASDYSATVTWGDGDTSTGSITASGSGFVVTATKPHPYAEEGSATVQVSIKDASGATTDVLRTSTTPTSTLTGLYDVYGAAVDGSGNFYAAESIPGKVAVFAPGSTTPSSFLTGLQTPTDVAIDPAGNVFVYSFFSRTIAAFPHGQTTPAYFLSGLNNPVAVAVDAAGNAYVSNQGNNTITRYAPGSATPTATLTGVTQPGGLVVDLHGNVFVHGLVNGNGTISVFASGSLTPTGTLSGLSNPAGLAVDAADDVFVPDSATNTVVEFAAGSTTPTRTLTGLNGPGGMGFDGAGNIFALNSNQTVSEFAPGSVTPTATLTGFSSPIGFAVDAQGNVYVNRNSGTVTKFGVVTVPSVQSKATIADAALTASGVPVPAVEGQPFTGLVASFTDADPNGTATDYTATINWGDGTPTSSGTVTANGVGGFNVTGTHTFAEEGPANITVTITDAGSSATAQSPPSGAPSASAPVSTNLALWLNADQGVTVNGSGQVTGWSDQSGNGHNGALQGSGVTLVGNAFNGHNALQFAGSCDLALSGQVLTSQQYTVIAVATDQRAAGDTSFREIFSNWDGSNSTSSVFLGTANNNPDRARFTDYMGGGTDPNGHVQTGAGVVSNPTQAFLLTGVSTASDAFIYQDQTLIAESGSAIPTRNLATPYFVGVQGTFSGGEFWQGNIAELLVYNGALNQSQLQQDWSYLLAKYTGAADAPLTNVANVAFSTTEGLPFSGTVASFTDPAGETNPADFSATITWGDGSSSPGTIAYAGTPGNFTVNASGTPHSYAEEGLQASNCFVTINHGTLPAVSTPAVSVTVQDAAPTDTSTSASPSATEGAPTGVLTVATFTDANPGDNHADFTAIIYWGDGSSSTGTVSYSAGSYSVTGSYTYADEGSYPVTVDVTDDGGSTLTGIGKTTVSVSDVALTDTSASASASATEGASTGVLTVATFTDGNSGDNHADFTATIHWGDGSSSTGTVSYSAGSYSVTGSYTYADEGSYAVTVDVTDDGGSQLSGIGKTTVSVSDAALTDTSASASASATEGAATGVLTVATFTDVNPGDNHADFTATIHWGDGTSSGGTVTYSAGSYSVTCSYTYADEGSYAVTVDISDDGGSTLTGIGKTIVSVSDAALTDTSASASASATEAASTGVLTVATFTDANPGDNRTDFTATIHWGDGKSCAGTVSYSGGSYSVTGSHTYDEGSYAVTVDISDDGGSKLTGIGKTTVSVSDVALTDTSTTANLSATEGASSVLAVATFADASPGDNHADFTATIHWGDGTTSSGTVTYSAGSYAVSGNHAYAEEGSYSVTVDVADDGGSKLTGIGKTTVTVGDAPLSDTTKTTAISATEGAGTGDQVVGTFTDADPNATTGDYTATIYWGDNTSSAATSFTLSGGIFSVHGGHTYAEEGAYHPYAVVIDNEGNAGLTTGRRSVTTSQTLVTVTVADAPLAATGRAVTPVSGTAFTGAVASFTDADPAGTATDYTATITWGNGKTSAGTIAANGQGGFSVTGTNTYTADGTYPITLTIRDAGGSSASASSTAYVGGLATHFSVTAATAATAGTPFALTVKSLDAKGNPAYNYTGIVHFTSSDAKAVLPADYTFLPSDLGQHGFSVTLVTVGTRSVTATDTAKSTITGTQAGIVVSPGAVSKFVVSSANKVPAGAPMNVTVIAQDAYGNTVTGYRGTVHLTSTDPQAVLPANYTFSATDAGKHTFSVTLKTAGSQTVTVSDTNSKGAVTGTSGVVTVTPAAATHFAISAPASVKKGVSFSFTLTALDAYGNVATGYVGTVHFTSSDSHAGLPANYTFQPSDAGVVTFSTEAVLNTVGVQSLTATDTKTKGITGTDASIQVS